MSYFRRSRYSYSPSPKRYSGSLLRSISRSRYRSRSLSVENPRNNLYVARLSPLSAVHLSLRQTVSQGQRRENHRPRSLLSAVHLSLLSQLTSLQSHHPKPSPPTSASVPAQVPDLLCKFLIDDGVFMHVKSFSEKTKGESHVLAVLKSFSNF
ncbi:hypothetical protein ACFX2J_027551 [Malus domestica]